MWNNTDNDELNDDGQPVQLYVPIETNAHTPVSSTTKPTPASSYLSQIGGYATELKIHNGSDGSNHSVSTTPICTNCNDPLWLLVQMTVTSNPPRRDVSVFCCPKQDCFATVTFDKGFSNGGQGIFQCIQQQQLQQEKVKDDNPSSTTMTNSSVVAKPTKPAFVAPVKSSWYNDNEDDNGDDDWGVNDIDDGLQKQSLEDALTEMENALGEDGTIMTMTTTTKKTKSNVASTTNSKKPATNNKSTASHDNAFKCYRLKVQDEPMAVRPVLEEDDVGMLESDEKIRNMLARYMAEEDDEEILAALRGTSDHDKRSGTSGNGGGEEDERLTDEERILRGFQDRLRRVPKQVIRRATPNGIPLWSVPDTNRKSGRKLWSVPNCASCGCDLSFQFQLLPSILSTLQVDKYYSKTSSKRSNMSSEDNDQDEEDNRLDLGDLLSNGLNFGSVAVFACDNISCPAKSSSSSMNDTKGDVFLVIQESVDERMPSSSSKNFRKNNKRDQSNRKQPQQQQQQQQGQQSLVQSVEESVDRSNAYNYELPQATMAIVEDLDDDDEFELDG